MQQAQAQAQAQTVYIVDDNAGIREGLSLLLETVGLESESYCSADEFLKSYGKDKDKAGCLVLDIRMPRMTGLDLQDKLNEQKSTLPIIFISGHGDIPMAVEAMRKGALDFIRKPFREQDIIDRVNEALALDLSMHDDLVSRQQAVRKEALLTDREREVFKSVTQGKMNKVIGYELGISERTVEVHRSQVKKKLGAKTLAELVRIKIECEMQLDADRNLR